MRPNAAGPADPPTGGHTPVGHVFISYVHEDTRRVDQLHKALTAAGIPVWRDTEDLQPGENWPTKIRQAITDNALVFIVCFSQASTSRYKSYQNEELNLAIEQLRQRQPDDLWIIPVRLDECDIPDRDIGGGRTLASIQHADLFGDRYDEEITRLIASVRRVLGRRPGDRPSPRRRAIKGASAQIMAALAAVAVLLAIVVYMTSPDDNGSGTLTITGSVACESGRPVIAVWIAASAGQSDSGYAHLGPPDAFGVSYPIGASGTYSYLLRHGGSYAVHVGCGGSSQRWDSSNYSPLLSGPHVTLRCNDPISASRGSCVALKN
jgi:hypothetical protein